MSIICCFFYITLTMWDKLFLSQWSIQYTYFDILNKLMPWFVYWPHKWRLYWMSLSRLLTTTQHVSLTQMNCSTRGLHIHWGHPSFLTHFLPWDLCQLRLCYLTALITILPTPYLRHVVSCDYLLSKWDLRITPRNKTHSCWRGKPPAAICHIRWLLSSPHARLHLLWVHLSQRSLSLHSTCTCWLLLPVSLFPSGSVSAWYPVFCRQYLANLICWPATGINLPKQYCSHTNHAVTTK